MQLLKPDPSCIVPETAWFREVTSKKYLLRMTKGVSRSFHLTIMGKAPMAYIKTSLVKQTMTTIYRCTKLIIPPYMCSERGAARTLNRWLKKTIGKRGFSHPMSCCINLILWMTYEASTLDEFITVLSTVWCPMDSIHIDLKIGTLFKSIILIDNQDYDSIDIGLGPRISGL